MNPALSEGNESVTNVIGYIGKKFTHKSVLII